MPCGRAIRRTDGFGRYDVNPKYDWCGAFARWCWKMEASIKQVSSPFGDNNDKLLSLQKNHQLGHARRHARRVAPVRRPLPFRGGK